MLHSESVRDRNLKGECFSPTCLDLCLHFFRKVFPRMVIESHVGAFTSKHFADRGTDAARSAGYKRTFSL